LLSKIITDVSPYDIEKNIKEEWNKLGLMSFDNKREITRLECAIIIDKFIDPFNNVDVDIYGNPIK